MATQHGDQAARDIVTATQALAPLIQESLGVMEAERRSPVPLIDALRELGAFRMAVPRVYGGLELDPMTQVRVVEELSRMDGSVGWCAMISSAGSFASAFLAPSVAQRLCGQRDFSLAGQVVPVGRAELVMAAIASPVGIGSAAAVNTPRSLEGLRAFMEKRPPGLEGDRSCLFLASWSASFPPSLTHLAGNPISLAAR